MTFGLSMANILQHAHRLPHLLNSPLPNDQAASVALDALGGLFELPRPRPFGHAPADHQADWYRMVPSALQPARLLGRTPHDGYGMLTPEQVEALWVPFGHFIELPYSLRVEAATTCLAAVSSQMDALCPHGAPQFAQELRSARMGEPMVEYQNYPWGEKCNVLAFAVNSGAGTTRMLYLIRLVAMLKGASPQLLDILLAYRLRAAHETTLNNLGLLPYSPESP